MKNDEKALGSTLGALILIAYMIGIGIVIGQKLAESKAREERTQQRLFDAEWQILQWQQHDASEEDSTHVGDAMTVERTP